jgi:hypothetical protein
MFITRAALPRRIFLRGMGAAVALPLLDAMVPALSATARTAANPARRLGFIYVPNGAIMDSWTPSGEGRQFEFSPTLRALERFRDQVVVVSGLANKPADALGDGGGDHPRGTSSWLNATHPKKTEGADIRAGTTIDQIAATELGRTTPLPSLELGLEPADLVGQCGQSGYSCVYMDTISWRTPTQPLPREINPRIVFERLFGDGRTREERLAQFPEERSLLDALTRDVKRLQKRLGAGDRTRVDEYFEAIREIEQRIQKTERTAELHLDLPERPIGVPDTFEEHCTLMWDLQVLAFQADITRVISFMMAREFSGRTYPTIGVTDPHHAISHHQDDPDKIARVAKINAYHVQTFTYFLERLRATPDGDGSLLDHTLLLYGGGLSDGNQHTHSPLPVLLAGGGAGQLKGGRHLRYPKDTPMANLLLSLLDKVGVPMDKLGDSTGPLDRLSEV